MGVVAFWDAVYLPFIESADNLKPATIHGFKQVWNQPLKSHFGTVNLSDYKTHMMSGFLTGLARTAAPFRFTAFEEKVICGDLADGFHLVYTFSLPDDPLRATLDRSHFDGIYLGSRKMPFISQDFRSLMLEIWQVKYLQMPRFRELISSIPIEIRLEHFLNDGDSPDIPIPIYVGYLNQIRDLARRH
jgi:hypothetical protein